MASGLSPETLTHLIDQQIDYVCWLDAEWRIGMATGQFNALVESLTAPKPEPATILPQDLKPWDRVRLTFEGTVNEEGDVRTDDGFLAHTYWRAATLHLLSRAPEPEPKRVTVVEMRAPKTVFSVGTGDEQRLFWSQSEANLFAAAL